MMGAIAALASSAMSFGGRVAMSIGAPSLESLRREPMKDARRKAAKARDPYFGIKSKGRTGARARAQLMVAARRKTSVGKLDARGADQSNPFKDYDRRIAYNSAVRNLSGAFPDAAFVRALAMKSARRVAA
jgi:hypothetical protein